MGDIYVYHFVAFRSDGGLGARSTFAATLAAIEKLGEPIMDSQIVVDGTEVNAEGFLFSTVGFGSHEITKLSAKIKTLELRVASRDRRAQSLNSKVDEVEIYMLNLEGRHLRQKAVRLMIERAKLLDGDSDHISLAHLHFASRTISD